MASELRVGYSDTFQTQSSKKVVPVTHGYDFAKTYNHDLQVDLNGWIVKSYHFDEESHFVGVSLAAASTKEIKSYIALGVDLDSVTTYLVDDSEEFESKSEKTRLIGFRTAKRCKQTNYIS